MNTIKREDLPLVKDEILAVSYADSSAMGSPNKVIVVKRDGVYEVDSECTKELIEDIGSIRPVALFCLLFEGSRFDFRHSLYAGMGNNIIILDADFYARYREVLGVSKDEKCCSYAKWRGLLKRL